MPPKPSPILGGFSRQRSPNAADNETINLLVEAVETKDGIVPGYMTIMSGLTKLYTVGTGPIRGMLALADILYVVSGNQVYSVSANATITLLGTINGTKDPVSMFQNTKQLMILDGIGAWLVPGGYPLTGGTLSGGSLYAIGDTVVLESVGGGTQTALPQIKITSIANEPVEAFLLANAGTTYTGASNVATAAIQPQGGTGTGLTLNITAVAGAITVAAVNAGGTGWSVGDTGTIHAPGVGGWFQVRTVVAGAVTAVRLVNRGAGYVTGTGVVATAGVPFPTNVGVGFTLNTVATAGPITSSSANKRGKNYQVGNVGTVSGGTGDATYLITAVGGNGVVTGFSVVTGGAISAPATSFNQQTTDGSGQNLTLVGPSFGSFLALVPITLPFSNPVAGIAIDGFGLAVFLGQQVIAQSNQLDLSTWQTLAFGTSNQSPDNIVSIASIHDEAYVFKERHTAIWADQGTANFAFAPLGGAHISWGCCAPFSPAQADNDLIWLTRNDQGQGVFVKASGYTPQVVSTQALTNEIQTYSTISDCISYSRQEGGHTYYVATFPSANVTWCYDKTTSEFVGFPIWTRMAAFSEGALNRHWGNAFTTWQGSLAPTSTQSTYQARGVTIGQLTSLQTAAGLNGLISSFTTAVFSVWMLVPDGVFNSGIVFGNQQGGVKPGLQITIEDDGFGGPQLTVQAWDASSNPIVVATYNFTSWANWVNILVSIDSANNKLQVWANTLIANQLVENHLTPSAITWSSTNPIGAQSTTPWSLKVAQ